MLLRQSEPRRDPLVGAEQPTDEIRTVTLLAAMQQYDVIRQMGYRSADDAAHVRQAAAFEEQGMPLVDWFRITPGYDGGDGRGDRTELYESILRGLQPGVTYFSLHPNAPGDIEIIDPVNNHWRIHEYNYFRSDRLAEFLAKEEIVPIGYREIREVMRKKM